MPVLLPIGRLSTPPHRFATPEPNLKTHIMMTEKDKQQLAAKGISEERLAAQLACFAKGFPYLKLSAAASTEKGILAPSKTEQQEYMAAWDAYTERK